MIDERERTPRSRHEQYAHPTPVLTCPVCIWLIAGRLINRRHSPMTTEEQREEELREVIETYDTLRAQPIRHRVNRTLPEETATWDEFQSRPWAEAASCDYLNRKPPRRADCSCGAIVQRDDELGDARDAIIEAARR